MEEKKSHTKNERSLPDHEEQELWFSALAADDSCAYNVDKAFDRFVSRTQQKRRTVFNIPKIVYGAAAVILLLIASTISFGKRAQFSGEPPYSSVLLFHTGDKN